MTVLYYYDWEGELSSDGEGGLVELCDRCAGELGDAVGFASDGCEDGALCERCEGKGNPGRCRNCHDLLAKEESGLCQQCRENLAAEELNAIVL